MVATWKFKRVEELSDDISKSKVIGLVDIAGIPSRQFQLMRKSLTGKAEVVVTRTNLMRRSLENAKIKGLDEHIIGSMGLILTDLNPFKLNKILKENRIAAPAKAGNIAPADIVIPEGETSLPAGPIISDLQKLGIKAQIKAGKITITKESTMVKEGEKITGDMALVLTRLGIEPMELGLTLNAAYEDGLTYGTDLLAIDENRVLEDMQKAYSNAFNLAYNASIYTTETVKLFLSEAHRNALNVALNSEIINSETIEYLISKANIQMLALAAKVPDALSEELRTKLSAAAASAKTEEKEETPEEPEEEETDSEEEAASGLASLFG